MFVPIRWQRGEGTWFWSRCMQELCTLFSSILRFDCCGNDLASSALFTKTKNNVRYWIPKPINQLLELKFGLDNWCRSIRFLRCRPETRWAMWFPIVIGAKPRPRNSSNNTCNTKRRFSKNEILVIILDKKPHRRNSKDFCNKRTPM